MHLQLVKRLFKLKKVEVEILESVGPCASVSSRVSKYRKIALIRSKQRQNRHEPGRKEPKIDLIVTVAQQAEKYLVRKNRFEIKSLTACSRSAQKKEKNPTDSMVTEWRAAPHGLKPFGAARPGPRVAREGGWLAATSPGVKVG